MRPDSVQTKREMRAEKEALAAARMREAKDGLETAFWEWTLSRASSARTAERLRNVAEKLALAAVKLDEVEALECPDE